jgi:uncharacterized phiE125 gp8 family phage protein
MTLTHDHFLTRGIFENTRSRLLLRVSDPQSEPVTLTEAKTYLRVDSTDQDSLIGDLIVTARALAEQWLKRSLITQSWKLSYGLAVGGAIALPMGPIVSITSVVATLIDGSTVTLDPAQYYLNAAQDGIIFKAISIGQHIDITYVAGYGDATLVPKPIKLGILAHIASLYDDRGQNATTLPEHSVRLYAPYRGVGV